VPTVRELARDVVDEIVKLDSKVLTTFRVLLTRPGFLTTEYIAGRRVRYVTPFKLYFIASALFFLINSALGDMETQRKLFQTSPNASKWMARGAEFFFENLATISILLLPINALLLGLLFMGRRRRFLEYLVATIHIWSASYLLYAPNWLLVRAMGVSDPQVSHGISNLIYIVVQAVFQALSFRTVYRASWLEALTKSALLSLLTLGSTMIVMIGILVAAFLLYR